MLFEPVLHDMFAGEIRKVFTDWNGDVRQLNLILPVDAQPFERTRIGYVMDGATEKVCELTVPSLLCHCCVALQLGLLIPTLLLSIIPTEIALRRFGSQEANVRFTP